MIPVWLCHLWLSLGLAVAGCSPAPPPAPAASADYEKQNTTLLLSDNTGISTYNAAAGKKFLVAGEFPNWTPSGQILYTVGDQFWEMSADGSGAQAISGHLGFQPTLVQMGRNGVVIFAAVSSDPNGSNTNIWAILPGSAPRIIASGMSPSLALSGAWLAYTKQTPPSAGDSAPFHREVYRINVDGSGNQPLTVLGDPNQPDANAASISPDESQIAIFSGHESTSIQQPPWTWGYRNVAVIPATGGPRKVLTPCQPATTPEQVQAATQCLNADDPAWTPDGRFLIVSVGWNGSRPNDTEMVDLNGANFQPFYPATRGSVKVPLK